MKPIFILLATAAIGLSACHEKAPKNEEQPTFQNVTTTPNGPEHSASPMQYADTMQLGDRRYIVSLRRYEDSSLPIVRDEMGTDFYDNRVEITIRKDGQEIFSRTFSKEDFAEKASETDRRMGVFLGMSIDQEHSTASTIRLGAQVGQPGLEGEGSIFSLYINTSNGALSIERRPASDFQEAPAPSDVESGD